MASTLKVGYLYETAFYKSPKEIDKLFDQDYILSEIEKEIVAKEFDRSTELWTNREVVLAAKVLSANNPKKHGIKFASDNEMRRVYDIIFEVFRCEIYRIFEKIFYNMLRFIYFVFSLYNIIIIIFRSDNYQRNFKQH